MASQNDKETPSSTRNTIIAGIFALLAACIGGVFLLLNSALQNKIIIVAGGHPTANVITATAVDQPVFVLRPTDISVPPTSAPSAEFVKREASGVSTTQNYDVTLGDGEIIVGQSYGFRSGSINQSGGCSAFLIKGPGQFSFSVTDGAWLQYRNVTTADQGESLLQEQANYLVNNYPCTSATVKYARLP